MEQYSVTENVDTFCLVCLATEAVAKGRKKLQGTYVFKANPDLHALGSGALLLPLSCCLLWPENYRGGSPGVRHHQGPGAN